MKIKQSVSRKIGVSTILVILGVLLGGIFVLIKGQRLQHEPIEKINDLELPTEIGGSNIDYSTLFKNDDYRLYNDNVVSIYAVSNWETTQLIYVYKNRPVGRQLTDRFFLHVYIKDDIKTDKDPDFISCDFSVRPREVDVDGTFYYIFEKLLFKDAQRTPVPPESIKHLDTGRFSNGMARSFDVSSLTLKKIQLTKNYGFDKLSLIMGQEDYKKIINKTEEVLAPGVLKNEFLKGAVSVNGETPMEMGFCFNEEWTGHLENKNSLSMTCTMKGGLTVKDKQKFSIQHPKVRNFLWGWLFNKVIKDQGVIGLKYDYADVSLTVKGRGDIEHIPMGIMAIEESFEDILTVNDKDGILISFDKSAKWGDLVGQGKFNTTEVDHNRFEKYQIKVIDESKVLADQKRVTQLESVKELIEGLYKGSYTISDVFDVDNLTTYFALVKLFGGNQSLVLNNMRFYYDPITKKLEPVYFESDSGTEINRMFNHGVFDKDSFFQEKLLEKLRHVSSSAFINGFMSQYGPELDRLSVRFYSEFEKGFTSNILEKNSRLIKMEINPTILISANLVWKDHNSMGIQVKNLSNYPVVISNIVNEKGSVLNVNRKLDTLAKNSVLIVDFELNKYFLNAFVSKKSKKVGFQYPKDVKKLRLTHHVIGVNYERESEIVPFSKSQGLDKVIVNYKRSKESNYELFDFIEKKSDSLLVFKSGDYSLSQNLVIRSGFTVQVLPGFSLDLKGNASITCNSLLICKGTSSKPIKFFSSNNTGGGLFVTNVNERSELDYCFFDNLSNPKSDTWSLSGSVNFHESDVIITNSSFSNNRCEDGLNIIRSQFLIANTIFENTQSDAFDGDFVTGEFDNCTFVGAGNDGIDVSGSNIYLKDVTIRNSSDKGISAGENSEISGVNIKVCGGEIGIVSKDLSKINISNVKVINTRLGFSSFQKKSEYGVASIEVQNLTMHNNETNYLIENNSKLLIDNVLVKTVSNNVIDQMYGKEYGKSSH